MPQGDHHALLQADVNVKLVKNLRTNVKARANSADRGAGLNKRKIIEKSVVDELSSMLSCGLDEKQLVDFKKGKPSVVMFVGLQASPAPPLLFLVLQMSRVMSHRLDGRVQGMQDALCIAQGKLWHNLSELMLSGLHAIKFFADSKRRLLYPRACCSAKSRGLL